MTPSSATSAASVFRKPTVAILWAFERARFGSGSTTELEPDVHDPPPVRARACPAGRLPRVSGAPAPETGRPAPTRLADCRAPRPGGGPPVLATRMSTGPSVDSTSPGRAASRSRSDVSASNGIASPSIAATASARRSRERLATATRTPSRASATAMPRPIPRLAPRTRAVLPEIPRSTRLWKLDDSTRRARGRSRRALRQRVGYGLRDGETATCYEQIVDAANAIYGSHPHRRALHAKGLCCSGSFTATG